MIEIVSDGQICKHALEAGNQQLEQFRICRFARLISDFVINKEGGINHTKVKEVVDQFEIKAYGAFDGAFPQHVKQVLQIFLEKKNELKLKQLSFPLANKWVEKLVGEEKRDISKAILEALLIFLRQTVGSCFATAPIILVQINEPEFLFEDLVDLITRGHLKRVIDGIEYKVPISIKTSFNLEVESPLLRCYEYTVASFADWKIEFYKWNMYTGLGLDTSANGGLGEGIFKVLEEQLEIANHAVQTAHSYIKKEYTKEEMPYFYAANDILKQKQESAEKIAQFYPFFIQELQKLFPLYFQEVFDPEMKSGDSDILEDRPAGFRLLFKHGRSDPTAWSMIYEEKEYLKALEDFFRLIEADLNYTSKFEGSKELIRKIIDNAIQTIWDKTFIKNAFARIQAMHQKQKSDIKSQSPWAYISGGNLESLISCYFSLKNKPIRRDFFVESPLELCVALVEYMKDLPYARAKEFEDNPQKGILMTNEVHAFLFKPGLKAFLGAWQDRGNTYTYIRDFPNSIPFADTNWANELFAFIHNPKTGTMMLARQSTFNLKSLPPSWDAYFSKATPWTLWTFTY
jgi:hypothetical protein